MAELSTIARPYAEALFEASRAHAPELAQWQGALDSVGALINDAAITSLLSNPKLSDARRFELLAGLHAQPLPAPVAELFMLLIANDRLAALPEVATQFRKLVNVSQGVADCIIESAFPISAEDLAGLVTALARKFPFRLNPDVRLNPQLIGGVRVTVGDRVLDNSVLARLEAMRGQLTS